ncbi:hypothetical protein LNP00_06330 [Fructobacillus sp. M158]|nr:hypothetical protein [Fructobacillus parabroussonetiae]MCK8617969.1 hypothetical protein [Fructobacillus parabroussonetiae]
MFKVRKKPVVCMARIAEQVKYIETLEGTMKAEIGDYIITGIQVECWPLKPDIFKQTYEII